MRGRILLYHHIAEAPTKEAAKTTLFVHPEHFAFQMALLKRLFAVLPLDEFVARLRSRRLPPKAIALTFDDGTVDFVENALPALVGECLPATLFVVAGKWRPVRWFAYPFGETSEAMQAKVQEAGYEAAFTTQRGWATSANSLWALPRLAVPYWVGRVGFLLWLHFAPNWRRRKRR
ncbi:MAG: hypothetical protein IMHGJWDQ_002244 [Candidatus Fervidibacter sp.]